MMLATFVNIPYQSYFEVTQLNVFGCMYASLIYFELYFSWRRSL